jgi:hypothetical protein
MAQTVCPLVSVADRARLAAIVADRNRPRKHVARARLIPALGRAARRRGGGAAVRHQPPGGVALAAPLRQSGVDGLLRDKTRKAGKAPTPEATVRRVVALTCEEPPGETTHWTGRAMARTTGLSLRTVQRIWAAHQLQPHRVRTFKRSRDPEFMAKLEDIVGLYLPPAPCGGALGR